MMPWETFLQVIIFIVIGLGVAIALLMYLDGRFDPWVREYNRQELERLKNKS